MTACALVQVRDMKAHLHDIVKESQDSIKSSLKAQGCPDSLPLTLFLALPLSCGLSLKPRWVVALAPF